MNSVAENKPALEPMDHEYDGIREYDNPMPGWWVWMFAFTIVFSVLYGIYYHSNVPGRDLLTDYEMAVGEDLKARFAEMGDLKTDQASILQYMQKSDYVSAGMSIYKGNCVSCHGPNAEGLVGPNLTDEAWKNVKELPDVVRVVREGANNGAMPAWKTRMHPNEVVLVAAYVATLRGKNLPGPRPAEGAVISPWNAAEAKSGQ